MEFLRFLGVCLRHAVVGSPRYYAAIGGLLLVVLIGVRAYVEQLTHGLQVTGMTDVVSWGAYIANFTFVVGLAAGAVMLVIPAYIFHESHAKRLVLIAEGLAVAACTMAVLFVVVDLGHPERIFFMVPFLGSLNLPGSLLAWDTMVIPGYFLLNLIIPMVVLYAHHRGRLVDQEKLFPWIALAIVWAIALHVVTAFLFSASVARPFWHTALLGPRFLASAFCSGPAFLIWALWGLRRLGRLSDTEHVTPMLALIVTIALEANLIMLCAELFTEFYATTEHSRSAEYLFLGLGEADALVPWIRTSIAMQFTALVILIVRPLRERRALLLAAALLVVVAVWIEKGMGLIIPGFVPSPLGEIVEYTPSAIELQVCAGIWALGMLIFIVLARMACAVELGKTSPRAMPTWGSLAPPPPP